MTFARKALGTVGENLAVSFLERIGYRILHRNYRTKLGEIDIIAKDREYLTFIEVKTRKSLACGSPAQAVTKRKQMQIIAVAEEYLSTFHLHNVPVRFDVVSIVHISSAEPVPELLQDAFSTSD